MTTTPSQRHELCVVQALTGSVDVDEAWDVAWFFCMYGDMPEPYYRVEVKEFNSKEEMTQWAGNPVLHPPHSIPFFVSELLQYRPRDPDDCYAELSAEPLDALR